MKGIINCNIQKKTKSELHKLNNYIEQLHQRNVNEINTKGWYRFAKKSGSFVSNGDGTTLIFLIKQYHYNNGSTSCIGLLSTSTVESNIVILNNISYGEVITKVRHTYSNDDQAHYLEFYYNINNTNIVYVELLSPENYYYKWSLISSLEKTEEIVENTSACYLADLVTKNCNVVTNNNLKASNIFSKYIELDNTRFWIHYAVKSGICYVVIANLLVKVPSTFNILYSSMPMPYMGSYHTITDHVNGEDIGLIYIDADSTTLMAHLYKQNNSDGYMSFSYIVKE